MNKKYINLNMFAAAIFLLPFVTRQTNLNLLTASPTPTASSAPLFVKPGLLKNLKNLDHIFVNKRGELLNVKVTAVGTDNITVDNSGTSVKVDITASTHFRRKFWGKSSLKEISVGDNVTVIGKWVTEDKTEISAVLLRDLSIQKRFGVFFGTIKSLAGPGFLMTTIQRGDETVTVGNARIINRIGVTINGTDLKDGDRVRVRGLWDSANFTVTEVTEIKDFSIPLKADHSPSPEASPIE